MLQRVGIITNTVGHGEPDQEFLVRYSAASIDEGTEYGEHLMTIRRAAKARTEADAIAAAEATEQLVEFVKRKLVKLISIDGERCPPEATEELKKLMDLRFVFRLAEQVIFGEATEKKSQPSALPRESLPAQAQTEGQPTIAAPAQTGRSESDHAGK